VLPSASGVPLERLDAWWSHHKEEVTQSLSGFALEVVTPGTIVVSHATLPGFMAQTSGRVYVSNAALLVWMCPPCLRLLLEAYIQMHATSPCLSLLLTCMPGLQAGRGSDDHGCVLLSHTCIHMHTPSPSVSLCCCHVCLSCRLAVAVTTMAAC
jgi:hypothetical protein